METVAVSAYGVRSRAAQGVEIYCDRCSISNPGRTDCGIVIPNCSKYLVTWATVAIKLRSCTLCVSRSFWLARVTRSLVTRAMPSCSLLGTASKSAPRSNQRNQKNFMRVCSQQVDCWTHQARWQERADKLAKRAALKCLSFETFFLRVSLMRPRTIDLRGRRLQTRSTVCWANACEPSGN